MRNFFTLSLLDERPEHLRPPLSIQKGNDKRPSLGSVHTGLDVNVGERLRRNREIAKRDGSEGLELVGLLSNRGPGTCVGRSGNFLFVSASLGRER